MEITGLAIGLPGTFAILYKACMATSEAIANARDLDDGIEQLPYKFNVQQKHLKDWAESLKQHGAGDDEKLLEIFHGDEERLALVKATLSKIGSLFKDIRHQLDDRYGASSQAIQTQKSTAFRGAFRFKSSSNTGNTGVPTSGNPATNPEITSIHTNIGYGEYQIAAV
jgi:hypothetical protein